MNKFKQGDRVTCCNSDDSERWITYGKEYEVVAIGEVIETSTSFVTILADNGVEMHIPERHFILAGNWSNDKQLKITKGNRLNISGKTYEFYVEQGKITNGKDLKIGFKINCRVDGVESNTLVGYPAEKIGDFIKNTINGQRSVYWSNTGTHELQIKEELGRVLADNYLYELKIEELNNKIKELELTLSHLK